MAITKKTVMLIILINIFPNRLLAYVLYFPDYFPKTSNTCMGVAKGAILGFGDLLIAVIIMEFTFVYENVTTGGPKKKCTR